MSNRLNKYPGLLIRLIVFVLIGTINAPSIGDAQDQGFEAASDSDRPPPLLIRATPDDTPVTLARRYLDDAAKAWMIAEYNHMARLPAGEAILIPQSPFRLGGLTPHGYQTVPVLAFTEKGNDAEPAPQASAKAFGQLLRWLKTNAFITITPDQFVDFLAFSDVIPRRAVLITLDTQSRAFFDLTAPVFQALGFTATVFVATGRVGEEGALAWNDLNQLRENGFSIGCRGQYGRSLTRRKHGQSFTAYVEWIDSELREAKASLETHLDEPCRFLAYPQGGTNALISAIAAKLGFSAAFTQQAGDNPFFVNRFGIHRLVVDSSMAPEAIGNRLTTLVRADLN